MSLELSKSETLWIESESFRQVKQLAIVSSKPAIAMVTALLGMMYPYVEYELWLIWVALHLIILSLRILHIADIKRKSKKKYNEYKNVAIVSFIAFAWGSSAYPLLIGNTSGIKIIILNLILIYGIASTINLARESLI